MMVIKEEKQRLHKLLSDAIPLLCKNGLALNTTFCVQAMIGITIVDTNSGSGGNTASAGDDLILVCFKQIVSNNGSTFVTQPFGTSDEMDVTAVPQQNDTIAIVERQPKTEQQHTRTMSANKEPTVVKLEPSDNANAADMMYDANDEEYDENDVQYIEDDEQYDEGEEGGEEGYEEDEQEEDYDDGSGVYYDDGFVGNEAQTLCKSEPLSGTTYADCSGFVKNEQNYESQHFAGSSSSLQQHRAGMQQRHSATSHGGRMQSFAAGGPTPVKQRKRGGSVGGTPRGITNKVPRSTTTFGGGDASFSGLGGHQYSKTVQDLCQSLVDQSSIEGDSFVCHICSARLSNAPTLRNHIRGTHLALKSERCNICGETFKWPMQLARHRKRAHGATGTQLLVYQ